MSSVTLTVAGSDVTSHLAIGTLRVREQVDARSSLLVTLRFNGQPTVRLGQRITLRTADTIGETVTRYGSALYWNGELLTWDQKHYGDEAYGAGPYGDRTMFSGVIDSLTERVDDADRTTVQISASDLTSLFDRYLVAAAYENETAGAIVRDVLSNVSVSAIAQESLDVGNVEDGPEVASIVFNYQTVAKVLDELATYAGFVFRISPGGIVEFRDRAGQAAPFSITDASRNIASLSVKRSPGDYRNRQYLRAGKGLTASRTESFPGNGTRTYVLAFPVGKVPTVTVDGASKTVGIRGVDTGQDFYWNKDDPVLSQDDGATPLASGETLAVTYQGLYPILVQTSSPAEQAARATAEGTAGIYEAVDQDPSIDSQDAATLRAESLLARYGRFEAAIRFDAAETREARLLDLRPGHLITITRTAHNLDDACLVEGIDWRLGDDGRWRAATTALTGSQTVSWLRYWRALSEKQQGLAIRENEVVVIGGSASTFADTTSFTDELTSSEAAPVSTVGTALVGFSEVA